jgi:hypothetical protein
LSASRKARRQAENRDGVRGASPVRGFDHGLVVACEQHGAVESSDARQHVELRENPLLDDLWRRIAGEQHEQSAQTVRVLRDRHEPRPEREQATGRLPVEPGKALRYRRTKRIRIAVVEERWPIVLGQRLEGESSIGRTHRNPRAPPIPTPATASGRRFEACHIVLIADDVAVALHSTCGRRETSRPPPERPGPVTGP